MINCHIFPYFGAYDTTKISSEMVTDFIHYLSKERKLKSKTIKDIIVLLKQLFSYGNINVKIPSLKVRKKNISILTHEEQKKLEYYLIEKESNLNLGILLALYTGIRIGELCSIRWENIDLEKRVIHIENTISRIKNLNEKDPNKTRIIIDTPKTLDSIRTIPIPSDLYPFRKRKSFLEMDSNYLLTNDKKYIEPRTFYYHQKQIMRQKKKEIIFFLPSLLLSYLVIHHY